VAPSELGTEVEGLVLRPLGVNDVDAYFAAVDASRDHLARGGYEWARSASREQLAAYLSDPQDSNTRFGVWRHDLLIGRIDFMPVAPPRYSIGYWLAAHAVGRGSATAACRAALDYARSVLGATDVFAGINHGNTKSVAVVRRLGFDHVVDFATYQRFHRRLDGRPPDEDSGAVTVRPATPEDGPILRHHLVLAANWNPTRASRSVEETLADDHNARYVEDWGRIGDFGAVAEDAATRPLGAAWCRLLPVARPGYGFVADDIPELSIAVLTERRGQGIGARLLGAIEREAIHRGVRAVSLSVELTNPARHLYERSGYAVVRRADGAATMLRPLST